MKLELDKDASTLPLGLLPDSDHDQLRTPFGVFGRLEELTSVLVNIATVGENEEKDENEKKERRIIGYLLNAFAPSPDSGERQALKTALDFLNPKGRAISAYINWGTRFFRTAPLDPKAIPPNPSRKEPGPAPATAIAQPKTADPLKIAADGKGRLSLTHFVEEEWAGERSYAVVTVGRYERLRRSVSEDPEEDGEMLRTPPVLDSRRADVAFERVRLLAPPTLLLARTLCTPEKRYFHELIMTHAEATLSQQNISVIRKLEFNEIVRSYLRTFLHPEWARNVAPLASSELRVGLPQPLDKTGARDAATYDIDADVDTLLAAAPQARWNTTRYVDAAEPFYYQQTVRYRATAATDIESEKRSVILPSLPPDPVTPMDGDPVSFTKRRLKPEWHDDLDKQLHEWLNGSGHIVTVRLPRLMESLTPQARETYFAYECKRYKHDGLEYAPVGYVPDPDVRVLLLDQSANATATIAQLVPNQEEANRKNAQALFAFTALSADFAATNPEISPRTDWADGLYAKFEVNIAFSQCAVKLVADIAVVCVPTTLTPLQAKLLASDELPAQGPLSQLAPLTARMTLSESNGTSTLAMTEPLIGPAWLCRPHLSSSETAQPISQHDLAIGLRMVADTERRKLGALVAFDCGNSEPLNRELLLRIEESAIAILLKPDLHLTFVEERLKRWAGAGITLWRRFADTETMQGSWQPITKPDDRVAPYSCALCEPHRLEPDDAAQIRKEAWDTLRDNWIPMGDDFNPGKFYQLNSVIDQLAGLAYRRTPMRRPTVFIQRGNEKRTQWPPQTSEEGELHE